jgi:NADP-dependent 3-hydroxy acid dehydrogenase YdfG
MAMCQAVILQMRERQSGTIINVTESVTLGEFPPRGSLYRHQTGY